MTENKFTYNKVFANTYFLTLIFRRGCIGIGNVLIFSSNSLQYKIM